MLNASAMMMAIKEKMETVESGSIPSIYMTAFEEAVSEYLISSCDITYSWGATTPPPASIPDPIVSFTASLSFLSFIVGNRPNLDTWATALQGAILAGIIVPDDPTFVLSPLSFASVSPLVLTQSNLTTFETAMSFTCSEIITWLKLQMNTTPVPGVHGIYTVSSPGAIMTSII